MIQAVVDTNVLLVAERLHPGASQVCCENCINCVNELRRGESLRLAVDYEYRILGEYRNKLPEGSATEQLLSEMEKHGTYDPFSITPAEYPGGLRPGEWFAEIPTGLGIEEFDPSDRKLVAVAVVARGSAGAVAIVNATDSDWRDITEALAECQIDLTELCEANHNAVPSHDRQIPQDPPSVRPRKRPHARR